MKALEYDKQGVNFEFIYDMFRNGFTKKTDIGVSVFKKFLKKYVE